MRQYSTSYTIGFSAAVCVVCSLLVSSAAVGLRARQLQNIELDRKRNVLMVAGFIEPTEVPSAEQIDALFEGIEQVVVDRVTGEETDISPDGFDQQVVASDLDMSQRAPANAAGVRRLPDYVLVYKVYEDDRLDQVVIPIEGMGLWSTLYGFLSLDSDGRTIRGITFYEHAETPGLGGEIDNPRWRDRWEGRLAYDDQWEPRIEVIKGRAGPPQEDPFHVDGLSGATITARGVGHLVQFWLGENGLGPYLAQLRERGELGEDGE